MKIGLVDSAFFALQDTILKEGHELHLYVEEASNPSLATSSTKSEKERFFTYPSLPAFLKAIPTFDLVVTDGGFVTSANLSSYQWARAHGIPAIGYETNLIALEQFRDIAFQIVRETSPISDIKLPEAMEFFDIESLTKFLRKIKKSWVLKKGEGAPTEDIGPRTIVIHPHTINSVLPFITNSPNSWFDKNGKGGARLEEFISGHEWSFAVFYDGTNISQVAYAYKEYKGAQNGDRGGVQTGEVGTLLQWEILEEHSPIYQFFSKIVSHPALKGKFHGMIDINTIVNEDFSHAHLIEFTPRWGRPSLDVMLGAISNPAKGNFCSLLLAAASGNLKTFPLTGYKEALQLGKTSVGVTLFDYGNPFVLCVQKGEKFEPVLKEPRQIKKLPKGDFCRTVPIFGFYDNDNKTWKTIMDPIEGSSRHFVTVGCHKNGEVARDAAYKALASFEEFGITWRDDIGKSEHLTEMVKVISHFLKGEK